MSKQIQLTFPEENVTVRAEMLEEVAPKTCQTIWDLLPLEGLTIHGMYSGAEIFIFINPALPIEAENLVNLPLPGDILFFHQEGGKFINAPNPYAEVCIDYGRSVQLRGEGGVPTFATLFARILGDWRDFQDVCKQVRYEGPKLLKISKILED